MIKHLGNCGNKEKLNRIYEAILSAKQNNCAIAIVLDPNIYGKSIDTFASAEVQNINLCHNRDTLFVVQNNEVTHQFPWWDIIKISVIW